MKLDKQMQELILRVEELEKCLRIQRAVNGKLECWRLSDLEIAVGILERESDNDY